MSTATEEHTIDETLEQAFKQEVDSYEAGKLDCPPGGFKVRLTGNFGKQKSNSSDAVCVSLRFEAVEEAVYDENGIFTGETREVKPFPHGFFYKYWITKKDGTPNEYAVRQVLSWLRANDFSTKGELNPRTNRHEFDIDAALAQSADKYDAAWTFVTHEKSDGGRDPFQIELDDFAKTPRYRAKKPKHQR